MKIHSEMLSSLGVFKEIVFQKLQIKVGGKSANELIHSL